MKKYTKGKPFVVWGLIAAMAAGNVLPVLAYPTAQYVGAEDEEEIWDEENATPSDASNATSSNAEQKKGIFEDMPEIGTAEFTEWFFSNIAHEDLWNWVLELLASSGSDEYEAFMPWYLANEERINAEMQKFPGISLMSLSTGDLWNGWVGDMDWQGSGTESEPYQITSLSELMGLSELAASGLSFEGYYFELTRDIDLSSIQINGGNWNPIGWYQNTSELPGSVSHPFKGHFDGAGNTISGLHIVNTSLKLHNIGLFGSVEGGTIKNLTVEADYVYGMDNIGILAGSISDNAIIYNVAVSGYLYGTADAGGVAGEISGSGSSTAQRVTVENCTADGIVIYSEGSTGFVGGIAGNVRNAYLIDNTTYTYDGDSNRVQGKGYVGGIAGKMNQTDIYNSYVSGTIGGNGAVAAGGIVGKYESGNLMVARFIGDIAKTNNGTASREGTFVGTREGSHNFTYGTGSSHNIAYLFSTSASKAKAVFGSNIDGDNTFTTAAHIGYEAGNKYVLVAGSTETSSGDRYYYEELEGGMKHIITQKLNKEFTASGYYDGLPFKLDHFAPGYQGEPVRGYLVSVPRIDALNANGTYDTDVAALTALPTGNNSFYRQIDKDNPSAVAYGVTVTVTTAPNNSNGNRYQMVYSESEAGKVKPPTYVDEMSNLVPMAYQAGGTYTFTMPECDTEINVEYQKVTTELTMTPAETTIAVTQTRSGDRKNPSITTEVKNAAGVLIARYIDGVQDNSVEVQPVSIHAEHNNTGSTADKTVMWSVDDTNLITNTSATGYTLTDARIMPNLQSNFIQSIIAKEVQAQVNAGYANLISSTVYTKNAVVTAATNPATSVDNQAVYGNTKLTVSFQIVDNTTIRVEGLGLNKSNVVYTITRKLSGDRLNPTETITCSTPIILTATLNPEQPFFKNVTWSDKESGKIITLTPSGSYTQDCTINIRYDAKGQANPAWIQNVINSDNTIRTAAPYAKFSGGATYSETVTAVSEDQTNGHVSAECEVTINFVTVDETVIHPENVVLDKDTLIFDLTLTKSGKKSSPTLTWAGLDAQQLTATVNPNLADSDIYKPYNRSVTWSSNTVLNVLTGSVTPNLESEWIQEVISKSPYTGTAVVPVTVTTIDNGKIATCTVTINVNVIDNTYSSSSGGSGGGGGGGGSSSGTTASGTKTASNAPAGSVTGTWVQTADGRWTFISGGRTYANEWAFIHNPYAVDGQLATSWFRFGDTGHMLTGWYPNADDHMYYLNPVADNTQGRMFTGWHWIDNNGDGIAECYYFDLTSGSLLINTTTPDGFTVNQEGVWIIDGVVQIKDFLSGR